MSAADCQIVWSDHSTDELQYAIRNGLIESHQWQAQLEHRRHLVDQRQSPPLFIKRYLAGGMLRRLRAMLGLSAARRAASNSQRLCAQQLPTAQALLVLRSGQDEWLVSQALEGPDLATLWSEATALQRQRYLQQAAALLATLHAHGFMHGDTKWENFVQHRGQLHVIDLDGLRQWGSRRRQVSRDLARFILAAEANGCTAPELQTFLDRYCEDVELPKPVVTRWILPRLQQLRRRHEKRYGRHYPQLLP